eukprot:SAG31_NODE_4870_length_2896_cov_2.419735_1_plen_855_part_10
MLVAMLSQALVLDVWTELNRRLAKTIYLRDMERFKRQILQLACVSMGHNLLASYTTALYKRLVIKWRARLTELVQKKYILSMAYFRLQHQADEYGVHDPDNRITSDINSVSSTLASLLYSTTSTLINSCSAIVRLALFLSPRYVVICGGYLLCVNSYRERVVPAIELGMLAGDLTRVQGEYQKTHLRLQEHSEGILSAGGSRAEGKRISAALDGFIQKTKTYQSLVRKEWWWFSGLLVTVVEPIFRSAMIELPFLRGKRALGDGLDGMARNAEVLGEITFTATLINRMMGQTRALMNVPRALLSAAGNATRVAQLLEACDKMVVVAPSDQQGTKKSTTISIQNITIQSPAGIELVNQLTIDVESGRNLLVCGSNGVGKTSLFRTMQGLWPLTAGSILIPTSNAGAHGAPGGAHRKSVVCYCPQSPYCAIGNLDQILAYPNENMSTTSEQVSNVLSLVQLDYLAQKYGPSDAQDWNDILSIGEKQRITLARVLLQKPYFAILDECMNTLGEHIVARFYDECQALRITCITVSHCPEHAKHHSHRLTLAGDGDWTLHDISHVDVSNSTVGCANTLLLAASPPRSPSRVLGSPSSPKTPLRRAIPNVSPAPIGGISGDAPDINVDTESKSDSKRLPERSSFFRMCMILKILLPKLSLQEKGMQLVLGSICLIGFQVVLTSKVLSMLPGQLQALVILGDQSGYVRLTLVATAVRMLSAVGSHVNMVCSHSLSNHWRSVLSRNLAERLMNEGNFYTLKHVDKRIVDADTRITVDVLRVTSYCQWFMNNVFGPVANASIMTVILLREKLPASALAVMYGYAVVGSVLTTYCAPSFANNIARTSELEGFFRSAHKRLLTNAE